MTATNHALTGALIGLVSGNPWVALPAALASHFVCDALPHYAPAIPVEQWLKTNTFRRLLVADATLCGLLVGILAVLQPAHWLLAAICAFAAASPDLLWINRFMVTRRGKQWHPNAFSKFAIHIQWFERPIGGVVEAAWFLGVGSLVMATILA